MADPTFDERVAARLPSLSPAERRIVQYFQENKEEVLICSALELAEKVGASDASVVRTAKAMGFSGLDALRRQLAGELRRSLSPAARLVRTLETVGSDPQSVFDATLDIHAQSIERLRRDIGAADFQAAIETLVAARRIVIFGIGPSSALAEYFSLQLRRFGLASGVLGHTGLLLADDLQQVGRGDAVVILAYSRVYPELDAVLERVQRLKLEALLLTDTLGSVLRRRVAHVLPVPRGRTDSLSMHTATLALIEALLVGIAARRPAETVASLELLNELRSKIGGDAMVLPVSTRTAGKTSRPARRSPRRR